ncbi:MAG TPA: hypothetical protein VEA69_11680 [Tepidisphaeraceae bacterium]|nr:hypothetical protein [Tepidisphaeraceae bacterium]
MKDFKLPEVIASARSQYLLNGTGIDDFDWYISPHLWTNLASDAGVTAPAQSDAEYGVVTMLTGTTDNNEVMVRSTNEVALFQADYGFVYESRVQFTEAATSAANVAVGLANAAGANLLSDDGGGDNINSSGVLIFKVDGETTWRCACENNGTVKETASVQTAGGSSYQTLRIVGKAVDATNMEFTYFLDGLPLTDSNNRPIKHTLAYASATEMRVVAGYLKCGSTTEETLNLDYCAFASTRV